ncbi:uncharacterized protein [Prorops nasuta]|uniref:uncharacterized protein isoform X1 n=1 Tax=Prorops nasuta TaxID=863751 RepID=UPI0034CD152B
MEISKSLQQEILAVQNKLKNAIRDHQACVMKLKDDPSNTDVLGRIHEIQLHIVSLGRCQKQVVQRLRKEVEAFKVENPNGVKITIAALLGVNNNNHITANQEERRNRDTDIAPKLSKQHYEEVVRNGNASPSLQDLVKGRSSSVETVSGEDDVIEVSNDENTSENQEEAEEDFIESPEKLGFLNNLGLITKDRLTEMQKKRTERKRRSTANPQFVYSSLEVPSKKKRYMQGNGSAPKTRQSKVKKGPSPPPPVKVVRPKSISPPTRANLKSLVPLQKTSGRPNILRNVTESKVFANKSKLENGTSQTQVPSAKTVQSTDRKTVHIPGLPSSLTIERIENDSIVCICCRNPGILTVCESCTSNFHVSCHSISPAPSRICPRCVGNVKNERLTCKKDEEFAATTYASGITGKTGEDTEVYKTPRGFYKTDAAQKKHSLPSTFTFGQLPSSTYLIPISTNTIPTTTINQSQTITPSTAHYQQQSENSSSNSSDNSNPYSNVVLNQLSQTNVTYIQQEPQPSYAFKLPINSGQSEKHQSYLIVKKISDPTGESTEIKSIPTDYNYQLPTSSGCYGTRTQSSLPGTSVLLNKSVDAAGRSRRKPANRAVPALNRIVPSESSPDDYKLERSTYNGRKFKQRSKLGINQLRSARATEILLSPYDAEPDQLEANPGKPEETGSFRNKCNRSRSGGLLHSLFTGYNKPDSFADYTDQSPGASVKDLAYSLQQYRQSHHLAERANESPGSQRRVLKKFFEHVKLEEAHLPAPPRAKLVPNCTIDAEDLKVDGELLVNREYVEDDNASHDDRFLAESNKIWISRSAMNKAIEIIECSPERESKNEFCKYDERNEDVSNDEVTSEDDVTILKENLSGKRSKESRLHIAQGDLAKLANEVPLPENKADTERQDLPGCEDDDDFSPARNAKNQLDQSKRCQIGNVKKSLELNAVSSESMLVLEQFESAMTDDDRGDTATCC